MSTEDTVAKLNAIGGKSLRSSSDRFKARTSDIFSPEKNKQSPTANRPVKRTLGRLQQKRPSQTGLSSNRRNSLSLPDEDEITGTPAPKPKKKAALKNKKAANTSPLKKHGYNLKLQDNPKVNLEDSPAKNTRSKNEDPLDALAKANLPIPEAFTVTDRTRSVKKSQPTSSTPKNQKSTPQKRKAAEALESEQGNGPSNSPVKRTRIEQPNIDAIDQDEDQQLDQGSDQYQESEQEDESAAQDQLEQLEDQDRDQDVEVASAVAEAETPKKRQGRPPKRRETTPERHARELQEGAREQEQREEIERERRDKIAMLEKQFAVDIEGAIQFNNCSMTWACLGGAASMIRSLAPDTEAASNRGKATIRCIKKLKKVYKITEKLPQPPLKQEKIISDLLVELEAKCSLLEPTDRKATNRDIVKDMYQKVIPAMVTLLKFCLQGRFRKQVFEEAALRELVLLIDLTTHVCNKARSWDPQPRTLEDRIKLYVRNGVLANLKRLQRAYKPDLERYDRIRYDITVRDQMKERQRIGREALEKKAELFNAAKKKQFEQIVPQTTVEPGTRIGVKNPRAIWETLDIDEIEDQIALMSRTRRESTADLPPPVPFSMSQEEQMALLNGLQQYTDENRYAEILQDPVFGPILKTRDLDDLVKAARSFSQMMASKMGEEVYNADSSFLWLRSTNSDI